MTRERVIHLLLGLGAAALYVALLAPVWSGWIADWWNDPNYGHGWLLALGLLGLMGWRLWKGGDAGAPSVSRRELIVWILAGAAISVLGILAAETATRRVGAVLLLVALVRSFFDATRSAALRGPLLAFLALVPWPYVIYYSTTARLQRWSSAAASFSLQAVGVPLAREGNLLRLPGYQLEVVEACSGLRSLLTLFALAAALAAFLRCTPTRTLSLLALSLPLALATNLLRLFFTGVAAQLAGPETAESVFHLGGGIATFVLGTLVLAWWARPPRREVA